MRNERPFDKIENPHPPTMLRRHTHGPALLAAALATTAAHAQDTRALARYVDFVRDDNDDVQYEFAEGTPAPSVVWRQGGNVITAKRVPQP